MRMDDHKLNSLILLLSSFQGDTAGQTEDERQRLREEFLSVMQDKFIRGEDVEFDYHEVDTNADYDDLKLKERDDEEKYFDEEEPHMCSHDS